MTDQREALEPMAVPPANVIQGGVTTAHGYRAAGIHCGIKPQKKDLALLVSAIPATVAGVFTTNKVKAAPVLLDMERIRSHRGQAVIINSGNANACTGDQGMRDAREMTQITAECLGVAEELVYVCSTGGIGNPLPMDPIRRGIPRAVSLLGDHGLVAAEAIMTSDKVAKSAAIQIGAGGRAITVGGMSKGGGMGHPDMATTISVLTTDAAVAPALLQTALRKATGRSFNRITIDGDMSTNDTILLFANGQAGGPEITGPGDALTAFGAALETLMVHLAKRVARDAEGATKLIEVKVRGAQSEPDAHLAAAAIGSSVLVKTAVYGASPNWGHILAAAGSSGAEVDTARASVRIGSVLLAERGAPVTEPSVRQSAARHLAGEEVRITVDLGLGNGEVTVWSCDFTEGYVTEKAAKWTG